MIKLPKLWKPRTRVQRHKHIRERRGSWWCCCEDTPPPPGCIYFEDDFGGSVIDTTKWEVSLGSWSVVSNVARTSSTNALIQATSTNGSMAASSIARVRSSGFNQAFIYTRHAAAIGGLFHLGTGVRIDFAQNKVGIVAFDDASSLSNVVAECPYDLDLNTFYTIRVCHHRIVDTAAGQEVFRGIITVFIDNDPIIRAYDPDCSGWHLEGDPESFSFRLALATGNVESGTYVEFDDVVATRLDPDGDARCHECAKCCWPYQQNPPDTITAQVLNLFGDLNPCLTTANLCQTLNNSSFQMTKAPYPYIEDRFDPNALIYFPCAYYTLGGLNFVCDDIVYNRVSLVVGTGQGCPGLVFPFKSTCMVEWRLWRDNGDTFYRSTAFVDYVEVVSYEVAPFEDLDALCGDFPLDLLVGPTGLAACGESDSVLRLTTP